MLKKACFEAIILLVKSLGVLFVSKPEPKKLNISFAEKIVRLNIDSQFTPKFTAEKKKRETKKREKKLIKREEKVLNNFFLTHAMIV